MKLPACKECGRADVVVTYRRDAEAEVVERIVAWLRAGAASETFRDLREACDIATKIERGDWRDDAKGGE